MTNIPDPPLTREEIYLGQPVKDDVADLILREGTSYLHDALAAKVQYEQKAAVLMGAYITLAVGLVGAALLGRKDLAAVTVNGLLVCGFGFGVSALFCMWALRDRQYGTPGINPRDWLTQFWLRDTGKDSTAAKAKAMMAQELQEDIRIAVEGNEKKANAISAGIFLAIFTALLTMATAGWELWAKH